MLTETRQIKHENLFELQIDLVLQPLKIHITRAGGAHPGKIVFPVGSPFEPYGLPRDQGFRSGRWLLLLLGAGDQLVIIIGPGLIVLVDTGQIRVVKYVQQFSRPTAGSETKLSSHLPATFVKSLILPLLRIANPRLGLHIVEPDVFSTTPVGPDIFARNAAGMAAETFV